jgi:hypothetical protein
MALTEPRTTDVPTIDGVPLTPKVVQLGGPPTFETVEDERLHRKQKLAGALRIFGRFGFAKAWQATSPCVTPSSPTTSGSTHSAAASATCASAT